MPALDRKGPPLGDGNQSGRRMGKCNPENKDQETIKEGKGMGRRWRNRFSVKSENHTEAQTGEFREPGKGRGMGRRSGKGFGHGQQSND